MGFIFRGKRRFQVQDLPLELRGGHQGAPFVEGKVHLFAFLPQRVRLLS